MKWGIIGCGDVTEVKSGPGFQKAEGSALVAVMRRDGEKARDYAGRHGVARAYDRTEDLIHDPQVDAVYVATPPSTHAELALAVAAAGKPCLVEKPMARNHAECQEMIVAFAARNLPLWVAYYRRALPRFLLVRDQIAAGAIGTVTSVHVDVRAPLAQGPSSAGWRFDPAVAGGGLFFDLASHCFDLLDFLLGPLTDVSGLARNTGHAYGAEDVTVSAFATAQGALGTGVWNFNASAAFDRITFTGSAGELRMPVFSDTDVIVRGAAGETVHVVRNPPHVHQPLIQAIVDEYRGGPASPST
ncbi:MAG TPA: Gfo/Idh/MocA family oxidoreductase, partial [Vicinamibacterales bacterium]|nr:Gfo/Idh/MocA family oxidoreductase [Vicinamibacterales bacterium]